MEERRAVLIKSPNWIGDCTMASPAVDLLASALPNYDIHILCRPHLIPLWTENPKISKVIGVDERKMDSRTLKGIKQARYKAAVLLTNSLGSAWIAWRAGAALRIGYNRNHRGFLLTHSLPYIESVWQTCTPKPLSKKSIKCSDDRRNTARHLVLYYLSIAQSAVQAIDANSDLAHSGSSYDLHVSSSAASTLRVNDLLKEMKLAGRMLIGINPGAAHGPAKRWSPTRLAQVAECLAVKNAAIVSTASPGESHLNDEVQKHCSAPIHRVGEKLDITGLIAFMPRLSLLITNDSGAMHLAAASHVPVVAIFGPTDWNSTSPWNTPHRIVRRETACAPCFLRECPIDHRCMDDIATDDVVQAASELIHQAGGYR